MGHEWKLYVKLGLLLCFVVHAWWHVCKNLSQSSTSSSNFVVLSNDCFMTRPIVFLGMFRVTNLSHLSYGCFFVGYLRYSPSSLSEEFGHSSFSTKPKIDQFYGGASPRCGDYRRAGSRSLRAYSKNLAPLFSSVDIFLFCWVQKLDILGIQWPNRKEEGRGFRQCRLFEEPILCSFLKAKWNVSETSILFGRFCFEVRIPRWA